LRLPVDRRDPSADVTGWLQAWSRGDSEAERQVYAALYQELRRQAARHLRRERRGHSLPPTGLVHEAYLRLTSLRDCHWPSRTHFLAMAARVMRHILVDHARRRAASKRFGSVTRVQLSDDASMVGGPDVELMALEQALTELARLDPEQARVVELRFFGGLSVEEAAEVLGVSNATVKREWRTARAWLQVRLEQGPPAGEPRDPP
jgi:RNA polymerase sigma-70 factor, ECF subfamily